jgi:hypothetical protein
VTELRVDLSEVAAMKVLTYAYLLRSFDRAAREDVPEAERAERDADGHGNDLR